MLKNHLKKNYLLVLKKKIIKLVIQIIKLRVIIYKTNYLLYLIKTKKFKIINQIIILRKN